jgi:diacylglycerol kinase
MFGAPREDDGLMPTTTPRTYDPLRKIRVAYQGLRLAMRDKAVAYKAVLAAGLLAIALAQRAWLDFGLVLVTTTLVLAAELFNTAIEELCDYVQPERAPQIGATKDIAAAAVSVCMGAWVIVMLIEGLRLLLPGIQLSATPWS